MTSTIKGEGRIKEVRISNSKPNYLLSGTRIYKISSGRDPGSSDRNASKIAPFL